ncbi:MAG: hypothetical protein AAF721_42520, partial [Myxococcota bacterium]
MRLFGPLLLATALVGCLRESADFVEPAGVYGDCSIDPAQCRSELVCQEVEDRGGGGPDGYVCSIFDCDEDEDCPAVDGVQSRATCRASNICTLDCTPPPCPQVGRCDECPAGASCAAECGLRGSPSESLHCVACPPGMDCIPWTTNGSRFGYQCAYR